MLKNYPFFRNYMYKIDPILLFFWIDFIHLLLISKRELIATVANISPQIQLDKGIVVPDAVIDLNSAVKAICSHNLEFLFTLLKDERTPYNVRKFDMYHRE